VDKDGALEVLKRLKVVIPVEKYEEKTGGKFAFRDKEDPRFADRRMQNLLRAIRESLSEKKYNPSDVVQILYLIVKLRLPDEGLINEGIIQVCENINTVGAVDTSLFVWALGKMGCPSSTVLSLVQEKVNRLVQ